MKSFEAGFDSVERAAKSTKESASQIGKIATRLENAAKKGEINAMRRELAALEQSLGVLRQQATNAQEAWPFQPEEEEKYLLNSYLSELRQVASEKELLETHEQDGRLIAHPFIVRTLASTHAVRVDKKQISTIRPSYLAKLLAKGQKKPALNTAAFLAALYDDYKLVARSESSSPQPTSGSGRGLAVPLSRIYQALTSLPGVSRDYDRTDFARDLYNLDLSGLRTKSGAEVFFPSTRQGGFQFVDPEGRVITYFAIQFSGS